MDREEIEKQLDDWQQLASDMKSAITLMMMEIQRQEKEYDVLIRRLKMLRAAHSVNEFRSGLEALINGKV